MKYGNKYGVNEDYLSLSCYHRNHRRPDCYNIISNLTMGVISLKLLLITALWEMPPTSKLRSKSMGS